MKKIVSIVLALAMVLALAISVSADAPVIREGDINFTVTNDWWEEIPTGDMFSSEEVNDVSKIVITADGPGVLVVYSNLDKDWTQTENHVNDFTVDFADVTKEIDGEGTPYVKLFASSASGTEINVHYVVYGVEGAANETAAAAESDSGEAAAPEASAPAETTAPADNAAPKTGLALAVVPAVMALAAVAVSKKR